MALRPLKPCNAPACPELVRGKPYCDNHQDMDKERKARADQYRGSSSSRGYDARWRKARKRFLGSNPLCTECHAKGRVREATVVDHIIPHKGNRIKFWDETNWQPMCSTCHSAKTAREDGGFGNPQK